MMDIAPKLLEKIETDFKEKHDSSRQIKHLIEKINNGQATYEDTHEYAIEVGLILSNCFSDNITPDILPNGKMYYNIAEKVIAPPMTNNYNMISDVCTQVQESLNKQAGISIKPVTPKLNTNRIEGIINRLSNEPVFADVAWILGEPIINFSQSVVDDYIKSNAEFHHKSGIKAKVVRKAEANCCAWCREIAGEYIYPDVPKDIYQRHENCRCMVTYITDRKKQDVWTKKQWTDSSEDIIIESRKVVGLKVNGTTISGISEHAFSRISNRNVDISSILDSIQNPLAVKPVKYDSHGRPSFKVVGKKATIAVNPENGMIITTYPTHTKTAKKLLKEEKKL